MLLNMNLGIYGIVDDMFRDFATNAPQLKRLSLHTTLGFNLDPQIPVTSTILCQFQQLELVFYRLNKNSVAFECMILDTTPKCFRHCKIKPYLSRELPHQRIRAKVASPTADHELVLQHHSNDFDNPDDCWQFWSYIDYGLLDNYPIGVEELDFTYSDDVDEIGAAYMDRLDRQKLNHRRGRNSSRVSRLGFLSGRRLVGVPRSL
ncbi:hypothetical protein COLO4_13911 [Corchorus olitorius]|uniref:Uncharacterized protein n=1 Tax=Corchorus olitorius TaxID=93759 RepID=A0A1R3JUH0_9ROSI|nr:hypothetical protein COLO4_13911 [Corchorus olitorius]